MDALTGYLLALRDALRALTGRGGISDLLQDIAGARAIVRHGALYPSIRDLSAALGYAWPAAGRSTHPPTAFLLLVPVAGLSPERAEQAWAWAMLAALLATAWAFGLRGRAALALAPLILWPPIMTALGQFTPLWLIGLALAWRWRDRAGPAGAGFAFAALAKILPLASLLWFLRPFRPRAFVGAALAVLAALGALTTLDPTAIPQYLVAQRGNTAETIARADNGALVPWLWHVGGPLAALVGVALLALVAWAIWRRAADDLAAWHLLTWLGVAALPIAWTYSLVPLLPGLVWAARRGPGAARVLALAAFLAPWLGPLPSQSPGAVALALACAGGALVLVRPLTRPHARPSSRALRARVARRSAAGAPDSGSSAPGSPAPARS